MSSSFWDQYAFSVGEIDFQWIDIALAAMARGRWAAFERRLAEGLACNVRANTEDAWPSQESLDAASTAFRYERDLISGADVNAWLERAGLTTEDWIAYLTRDLLRQTWRDEVEDTLDQFAPSARELVSSAVPEGICSGMFEEFEQDLCGMAAFAFEEDRGLLTRTGELGGALQPFEERATRLARTHEHWLAMRPHSEIVFRLSRILHVQSACETLGSRLASDGRLNSAIEANCLAWMQLEMDTISFAAEPAAREAVLCVREDGLTLYDVSRLSHRPINRISVFLDDLDPSRRDQLLTAEPGHVLGPVAVGDRFDVTSLVRRIPPVLSDPRVAERARQTVLENAVRRAARDHVRRRARS
jgi:hypothetical protein